MTKEDADKPPVVAELLDEDEYGVILPDGSINWDCPCLGTITMCSVVVLYMYIYCVN